jgi:hypothetical protein
LVSLSAALTRKLAERIVMSCGFKRGLGDELVTALNAEYVDGRWWKGVVDDEDLILGIRDGYLNVYCRGNSLWRIWRRDRKLRVETHFKYLLKDEKQAYIAATLTADDKLSPERKVQTSDLHEREALKRASKAYAGDEKLGVHQIVQGHRDQVLDVEVAFGSSEGGPGECERPGDEDGGRHVDRIDLAALFDRGTKPVLRFFEAKRFTDSRLRSAKQQPEVLAQLERYEARLTNNRDVLAASYQRVCRNLLALKGAVASDRRRQLLEKAAYGIEIDTKPVLVIFDYDEAQGNASRWKQQLGAIEAAIGNKRIIAAGKASSIRLSGRDG